MISVHYRIAEYLLLWYIATDRYVEIKTAVTYDGRSKSDPNCSG